MMHHVNQAMIKCRSSENEVARNIVASCNHCLLQKDAAMDFGDGFRGELVKVQRSEKNPAPIQ